MMGSFGTVLVGSFILGGALYLGSLLYGETPPTPIIMDGWFGRGPQRPDTDKSIVPFTVNIPDDVLEDLQRRLENSRLSESLENVQFQYGFQVDYMKEVLEHWRTKYDWREQEKQINQFPHFKTNIEGIDIHFLHVKPKNPTGKERPLLLSHGWPGSVWEFYKIIPILTDPASYGGNHDDSFEVICPSIPGYGFSEASHQTGLNAVAVSRIYVKLMERLGLQSFYVQGGDWGALISTIITQAYPDKVKGLHLNMLTPPKSPATFLKQIIANFVPSIFGMSEWEYRLNYPLSEYFVRLVAATGYMHIQATKPDTVAFGLNDSPVGLAAYILEKFGAWTNFQAHLTSRDGAITEKFTLDELLTNVMIYWVTESIGPSMRFYRENLAGVDEVEAWDNVPIFVPTGLAGFPNDLVISPRTLLEGRFKNITQYTMMPSGGHFAALEEPHLLAGDIFAFVRKVEQR